MRNRRVATALLAGVLGWVLAGCGSGGSDTGADSRPTVVVTTSVLGDVVQNLVGHAADVNVVIPPGADPHNFSPSAREVNEIREADAVVVNGAGFEPGLDDVIDSAEDSVPVHRAIDAVDTLTLGDGAEVDPHFFTDPARVADAAVAIAAFLAAEVPALDKPAAGERAAAYVDELRDLDAHTEDVLSDIPEARRVLVTNHEALAYFGDRYRFEVVGVIVPGGGTQAEVSGGELDELARVIEREDVPAIFADTSSPTAVAEALADEVGGVEVVELFSESLAEAGSPADTYTGMVRTNARRIAAALR